MLNSSSSQPTPNVTMMRPSLIQSAVANAFAMTMGCCNGSSVARVQLNGLGGTGKVGLRDGRVKVVRTRQLHVHIRNDEVFGYGDHVVAKLFGALGHDRLIRPGDSELPRLRQRL